MGILNTDWQSDILEYNVTDHSSSTMYKSILSIPRRQSRPSALAAIMVNWNSPQEIAKNAGQLSISRFIPLFLTSPSLLRQARSLSPWPVYVS